MVLVDKKIASVQHATQETLPMPCSLGKSSKNDLCRTDVLQTKLVIPDVGSSLELWSRMMYAREIDSLGIAQ